MYSFDSKVVKNFSMFFLTRNIFLKFVSFPSSGSETRVSIIPSNKLKDLYFEKKLIRLKSRKELFNLFFGKEYILEDCIYPLKCEWDKRFPYPF